MVLRPIAHREQGAGSMDLGTGLHLCATSQRELMISRVPLRSAIVCQFGAENSDGWGDTARDTQAPWNSLRDGPMKLRFGHLRHSTRSLRPSARMGVSRLGPRSVERSLQNLSFAPSALAGLLKGFRCAESRASRPRVQNLSLAHPLPINGLINLHVHCRSPIAGRLWHQHINTNAHESRETSPSAGLFSFTSPISKPTRCPMPL